MTKKILAFFFAAFLFSVISFAQNGPVISFEDASHDFGTLKQNSPATYTFQVKNTGTAPLFVTNVEPSCGCTTPDWTKTPIAPGKTGTIKITYDAATKGPFNKSVYVKSNASNVAKGERYEIKIKGVVK